MVSSNFVAQLHQLSRFSKEFKSGWFKRSRTISECPRRSSFTSSWCLPPIVAWSAARRAVAPSSPRGGLVTAQSPRICRMAIASRLLGQGTWLRIGPVALQLAGIDLRRRLDPRGLHDLVKRRYGDG